MLLQVALPSEHGSLNLHSDLAPRFIVRKISGFPNLAGSQH